MKVKNITQRIYNFFETYEDKQEELVRYCLKRFFAYVLDGFQECDSILIEMAIEDTLKDFDLWNVEGDEFL